MRALLVLGLLLLGACSTARVVGDAPESPVAVERDRVFLHRGDVDLKADVYAPTGAGPYPGVLLVHGGSWARGNKGRMARIGERLARRGYVAVSIDYRLAPEHRFPAQLHDCQAAVRWMRANATRLRLDPTRIGGFGYSAGAHLVALVATTDEGDGLDEMLAFPGPDARLQAAVLGAPPTDLRRFPAVPTFSRFLGATVSERPDLYALASPVTFVTSDDPPMFLYHGADDWMVDVSQSQLMIDALERVHVPASFYEGPGGHFATFLFDEEEVSHAIDFLDAWL